MPDLLKKKSIKIWFINNHEKSYHDLLKIFTIIFIPKLTTDLFLKILSHIYHFNFTS